MNPGGSDPLEILSVLFPVLGELDLADPEAAVRRLRTELPFGGDALAPVLSWLGGGEAGALLTKEVGGIRFGRLAKDHEGFSLDLVEMDRAGPPHRHPRGEIDLCLAVEGDPRFDGEPEGWVVYGADSVHTPTVTGGRMRILYLLPGGAFELLGG